MSKVKDTVFLEPALKPEFLSSFDATPSLVPDMATVTTSDKAEENYGWLASSPGMSEFLDERTLDGLKSVKYTLINRKFENSISVDRDELDDDQLGAIKMRINDMGQRAAQHRDELLFETLEAGTTTTGYDADFFFTTTHPDLLGVAGGPGDQSNLLTGTGTTTALLKTDVQTAITALKNIKDYRGKPFHGTLNPANIMIVCAPAIEYAMKEAVNATLIANTTNMLVGAVGKVVVANWLTDSNDWYMLYTGDVIKPLIFQDRAGIEFSALEGETERGFMREEYLYGSRARYACGYGLWQSANKTTNA